MSRVVDVNISEPGSKRPLDVEWDRSRRILRSAAAALERTGVVLVTPDIHAARSKPTERPAHWWDTEQGPGNVAWSWHWRSTMLPLSLNRKDRDGWLGLGDLTVIASRLPAATIDATRAIPPPPSPPPGFDVGFWPSLTFDVSTPPFLGDCAVYHQHFTRYLRQSCRRVALRVLPVRPSVCPSVCPVQVPNSKLKSTEKLKLMWTFTGVEVSVVPIFNSKGQGQGQDYRRGVTGRAAQAPTTN